MTLAPNSFGNMRGALLVGNFGHGLIHGYDIHAGALLGTMTKPDGNPITLDGLWALHTLGGLSVYCTAGIVEEEAGLFGVIKQAK